MRARRARARLQRGAHALGVEPQRAAVALHKLARVIRVLGLPAQAVQLRLGARGTCLRGRACAHAGRAAGDTSGGGARWDAPAGLSSCRRRRLGARAPPAAWRPAAAGPPCCARAPGCEEPGPSDLARRQVLVGADRAVAHSGHSQSSSPSASSSSCRAPTLSVHWRGGAPGGRACAGAPRLRGAHAGAVKPAVTGVAADPQRVRGLARRAKGAAARCACF